MKNKTWNQNLFKKSELFKNKGKNAPQNQNLCLSWRLVNDQTYVYMEKGKKTWNEVDGMPR